jgi:hypothetical protein
MNQTLFYNKAKENLDKSLASGGNIYLKINDKVVIKSIQITNKIKNY